MKKLLAVLAIGISVLSLSGCAGNFGITEKFTETNAMIAKSNQKSRKAYAEAMAACGTNAACQVGVSASYFSGAGQQQFFRPETVKDYLVAFMPYADLGASIFRHWMGGSSGGQGIVVNGKGNTVIGVGNKAFADRSSTLTYDMPTYADWSYHQNIQRDTDTSANGPGVVENNRNPIDDHSTAQ